jgi:hypothetical protein
MVDRHLFWVIAAFIILLAFAAIVILLLMNTGIFTNVLGGVSILSGIVGTLLVILGAKKVI